VEVPDPLERRPRLRCVPPHRRRAVLSVCACLGCTGADWVESGQGEQEEGKGNGGAEEDGKPEAIEGGWVFFFVLVRGCGGENNEFSRCLLRDGEEAAGDFCLMMQPDFLI
jgi:hypothetical protein